MDDAISATGAASQTVPYGFEDAIAKENTSCLWPFLSVHTPGGGACVQKGTSVRIRARRLESLQWTLPSGPTQTIGAAYAIVKVVITAIMVRNCMVVKGKEVSNDEGATERVEVGKDAKGRGGKKVMRGRLVEWILNRFIEDLDIKI